MLIDSFQLFIGFSHRYLGWKWGNEITVKVEIALMHFSFQRLTRKEHEGRGINEVIICDQKIYERMRVFSN